MTKAAWTREQIELLKQMAYAGTSNADIARILGKPVEDIHHKRSHMGLTIAKIEAQKAAADKKAPSNKAASKKSAPKPAPEVVPEDKPELVSAEPEPEKAEIISQEVYRHTIRITATKTQLVGSLRDCISKKCDSCGLNEMNNCRSILMTLAAQALKDNG